MGTVRTYVHTLLHTRIYKKCSIEYTLQAVATYRIFHQQEKIIASGNVLKLGGLGACSPRSRLIDDSESIGRYASINANQSQHVGAIQIDSEVPNNVESAKETPIANKCSESK